MNTSAPLASARPMSAGPLIALGLLALVWGYNWVVMKVAMRYVGPMDFAALRGVLGAMLLFALLWAVGAPMKPKHVVKTIFLGVFQTAGFVGLISWALNSGAAGKSAVLGYTMPFWVIVFGWPFLPDRLRGWQWPAAGLILIGLVLVLARRWYLMGDQRHRVQEDTRGEPQRPLVRHRLANGFRHGAARRHRVVDR